MATYDLLRAKLLGDIEAFLGSQIAHEIWAAIDAGGGKLTGTSVLRDFVPGAAIPADAAVVVVKAGASGAVSVPAHVSAIVFTDPATAPAHLGVDAAIAVRMSDGADILSVSAPADTPADVVVTVDLGAGDDVFVGAQDARNHVVGGAGNDRMTGGARNDRFDVGQGSDTVDGGAGYDRAHVHGGIDDYVSVVNPDGSLSLTHKVSGEVTTLVDLEFLTFDDGAVMLNVTDEAGFTAASLFEVVLGRGADPTVHEQLAGADAFKQIEAANDLLNSPEFSNKFGPVSELTDAAFLEILYATAFERGGDEEGLNYWLDKLATGMSRGEVAFHFAGSDEAHAEFAASINLIDKDLMS